MMTQPRGWPQGGRSPVFAEVGILWPFCGEGSQGNAYITGLDRGAAAVASMPVSGTLTEFEAQIGTVTTGGDITGSIETINASTGLVDGTLVSAGASATVTISSGAAIQYYNFTLSTPVQVQAGQVLASVVRLDASAYCRIYHYGYPTRPGTNHPSRLDNVAGTWVKRGGSAAFHRYKIDGVWVSMPQAWPYEAAVTGVTIGSSATPDEAGLLMTMPATMRCDGAYVLLWGVGASEDFSLSLLDSNNNVIRSYAHDLTITGTDYSGTYSAHWEPVTLYAGKQYRLIVTPLTTANCTRYVVSVSDVKYANLLPGNGSCILTERTNGGPWTNTPTTHAVMGISVNGVAKG